MNSKINSIILLFSFLFIAQASFAQNDYKQFLKLSYAEIDSLMYIQYNKGAYDKAIPLMKAGMEKSKMEFGEIDSTFAEYTSNLGFFYDKTGQYSLALPLYIQAKDTYAKALGRQHVSFVNSLNNLARLHENMGNFSAALSLLIEAKDISEKFLDKQEDVTLSLHNLANLYKNMGNFSAALPLYIQAKDIREKKLGKQHPDFAASLSDLATLHYYMGNFSTALTLLIQAKDIYEKVLGKEHPDFAVALGNLATLHYHMGNFSAALSLYIQAKDIYEKVLGKEHPDFALALNNIAGVYKRMGNFSAALPLLIQANDIKEKVFGKHALSLNNLANLYQSMGNFSTALSLYIQAKDIREEKLGKQHPDFIQLLNNLAGLYQQMGNYDKAWDMLQQAMNSSSGIIVKHQFDLPWLDSLANAPFASNQHVEKIITSLDLAYSLLGIDSSIQDASAKQIIIADLATKLLDKSRKQVSNEADKLRMLAQSNDWLQKSLNIFDAKQHTKKAFQLSDQNKSVLLLQATKSEVAYRLGELPDSLVWKDKKLLKKQSELQAKLLEKRSDQEKSQLLDELNHVNQDIDAYVEMIKKEFPKYHQLKYQQVDAKVEEIQSLLDNNTALLEYVIGDSVVHIFYVDKQQVVWKKNYISTNKFKNNVKSLHAVLSDYKLVTKDENKSYDIYTEKAYWFYENLIEPVLKNKSTIQNLIIVSDGELGHLPFEAFLVEQAPQSLTDYNKLRYLVSDYNISYNYSATLWKENKETASPKNNGQILGMAANYDIKLDSSMKEVRLPTDQWLRDLLKPLPAARKEVEALQEKYQGFFAFDKLASEKTVKEKASEYAILHFATHGILDSKSPMLSSLAFTEDNDSIESNFWQAHEISKLQLNADLVVLSACETGYGKFEKGNGIASLARAFMYAGASSLIVSLWQVNDFATSEIMKNLYANLAEGMNKDEALRQAKLQYMKEAKGILAHPAFWSPFIMMGKTDSVSIKTKGGMMPWVVGGFVAVLVLGGGVWSKKRKEVA